MTLAGYAAPGAIRRDQRHLVVAAAIGLKPAAVRPKRPRQNDTKNAADGAPLLKVTHLAGLNHVASALAMAFFFPRRLSQATYPPGRINTASGAGTMPMSL